MRVIVDCLLLNTACTYCMTTVPLAAALNINRRSKFIFCSPSSNMNFANSGDMRGKSCVLLAFSDEILVCELQQQQELPAESNINKF